MRSERKSMIITLSNLKQYYPYIFVHLNGKHMAMYRSIVNDVMVSTVALVAVSERTPCNTQTAWLNG